MNTLVKKLKNYKTTAQTTDLIKHTTIVFLVGPTGVGKDSLKNALLANGQYHEIISHTSRPPRINQGVREQEGREYHFIDVPTAEQMIDDRAFVEAKIYSGNVYGTSVAEIQAAHDGGEVAIADLEVQGVAEYKSIDPNIIAIFLVPPDFETWQNRLRRRYGNTVDPNDIRRRMHTALEEIDQLLKTDYYYAVINKTLSTTMEEIQSIVATRQHDPQQEAAARELARQLAAETRAYLENSHSTTKT